MIAYAAAMSLFSFFRRKRDDNTPVDEGRGDLEQMSVASGGGPAPGIASQDASQVAEGELSEFDAPSDQPS